MRSRGGRRTESEGSHALVNVTPHESAARAARLEHSAGWSVRRLATLAALLAGSIAISYFWREPVVRETVSLLLVLIAGVVSALGGNFVYEQWQRNHVRAFVSLPFIAVVASVGVSVYINFVSNRLPSRAPETQPLAAVPSPAGLPSTVSSPSAAASPPAASAAPTSTATASAEPSAAVAAGTAAPLPDRPPTIIDIVPQVRGQDYAAAVRYYIASAPELLNDRDIVLSYVDRLMSGSDRAPCGMGQLSEFDVHRYYPRWVARIRTEIANARGDVPVVFPARLGTYDFEQNHLPLELNADSVIPVTYGDFVGARCNFVEPYRQVLDARVYYLIPPRTVPQYLNLNRSQAEHVLNLVSGREVTVNMHGRITYVDAHFSEPWGYGFAATYEPSEVAVKSGGVEVFHKAIR
ncbi:MAG: hypothetical protein JO036_03570 [Candidatus Eremiobacteraeota bacterium]|nr:hypothetical protein [Candidatus Eremiobacteraeota bacterium]